MKLEDSVIVPVPVADVVRTLTDIEVLARCLPGATLGPHSGNEAEGVVRVTAGPIAMVFEGDLRIQSDARRPHEVRLIADARERRGAGDLAAVFDFAVSPVPEGSRLDVRVDVALTGRLAQMGGPVVPEISRELVREFARNLTSELGGVPQSGFGERSNCQLLFAGFAGFGLGVSLGAVWSLSRRLLRGR